MDRRGVSRVLALGIGLCLGPGLLAPAARGQETGGGPTAVSNPASAGWLSNPMMNPYANPYLNPAMNPYSAQAGMTPGNAGLYFYAAQRLSGGLGSGQLSGVRPAPGAAAGPAVQRGGTARVPATVRETPRTSSVPGANASRFFNRSAQASAGPPSYYNRNTRHFPVKTR